MNHGIAGGALVAPLPTPPGPPPLLDYAQLFSFQIAFRDGAAKGGEWEKAIMEVNFAVRTFIMLDKEHVIVARPFDSYTRCAFSKDPQDPSVSLFFGLLEWELHVQNSAEKDCMLHLLQCITKNLTAVEAVGHGMGIVGLDKRILKYGIILRKAKAKRKRTERYLVIVPGKLLLFAGTNILGRHVRSVTSLFRANIKISVSKLEFEIIPHHSKEEEMSSWITALETSIRSADKVSRASRMKAEVETSKTLSASGEEDYERARRPLHSRYSDQFAGTSNDARGKEARGNDARGNEARSYEDERFPARDDGSRYGVAHRQTVYEEGHRRVSLSKQRLKAAIEDMSDMISRLNVKNVHSFETYARDAEAFQQYQRPQLTDSSSQSFYTNAVRRAVEEEKPWRMSTSNHRHRRRRKKEAERYYRDRMKGMELEQKESRGNWNSIGEFRESWKHQQRVSSGMELPDRSRSLAPFISGRFY